MADESLPRTFRIPSQAIQIMFRKRGEKDPRRYTIIPIQIADGWGAAWMEFPPKGSDAPKSGVVDFKSEVRESFNEAVAEAFASLISHVAWETDTIEVVVPEEEADNGGTDS